MISDAHEFIAAETNVLIGVNRDSFLSTIDTLKELGFETFVDTKKTGDFYTTDTLFIVPCLDQDGFEGDNTLLAMALVGILKPDATSITRFANENSVLICRMETTLTLRLSWVNKKEELKS